jgi:hypothetical protein
LKGGVIVKGFMNTQKWHLSSSLLQYSEIFLQLKLVRARNEVKPGSTKEIMGLEPSCDEERLLRSN